MQLCLRRSRKVSRIFMLFGNRETMFKVNCGLSLTRSLRLKSLGDSFRKRLSLSLKLRTASALLSQEKETCLPFVFLKSRRGQTSGQTEAIFMRQAYTFCRRCYHFLLTMHLLLQTCFDFTCRVNQETDKDNLSQHLLQFIPQVTRNKTFRRL
jgi:hypothetical protein